MATDHLHQHPPNGAPRTKSALVQPTDELQVLVYLLEEEHYFAAPLHPIAVIVGERPEGQIDTRQPIAAMVDAILRIAFS